VSQSASATACRSPVASVLPLTGLGLSMPG
jgi:hypothetical protein